MKKLIFLLILFLLFLINCPSVKSIPPINQEPTNDPFVVVQYHSWYFDQSLKDPPYASYIPILEGEYYFRDFTNSTIELHVKWAKEYGIDAFVVSYEPGVIWNGSAWVNRSIHLPRVADIFEEKGMKWFFFTEDILLYDELEREYFLEHYKKYKDYSSYVKVNGKPVVMTYGSWINSSSEIGVFRGELEPVYLIGDFFNPVITQPEVYEFCQPQYYNIPNDTVEIWVRMKSLDGENRNFTEHFSNHEIDESLIYFKANTSSESYDWYKLGSYYYNGTYKPRLSDWSDPDLAVDMIKVNTTYMEKLMEAELIAARPEDGGIIISDPDASNESAVTRTDTGIYTWWVLALNHRSPIQDYFSVFDAFSGYNIRVEIDDWSTCISKVYDYFSSRSLPYTGWAGPGFNCTYADWCKFIRPYGPSKENFTELLDKAKSNSNWIFICNWNDFMEGTNIEPTEEQGYVFLDVLKQEIVCNSGINTVTGKCDVDCDAHEKCEGRSPGARWCKKPEEIAKRCSSTCQYSEVKCKDKGEMYYCSEGYCRKKSRPMPCGRGGPCIILFGYTLTLYHLIFVFIALLILAVIIFGVFKYFIKRN